MLIFYIAYWVIPLASSLFALLLIQYSWRKRGWLPYDGMLAILGGTAVTSFFSFLFSVTREPTLALLWSNLRLIGIPVVNLAYLYHALVFTKRQNWLKSRWLILFALPLAGIVLMILTNGWHHSFRVDWHLVRIGSISMEQGRGAWGYQLHTTYNMIVALFTIAILAIGIWELEGFKQWQAIGILLAILSFVVITLYISFALVSFPYFPNLIALAHLGSNAFLGWAMLRYGNQVGKYITYRTIWDNFQDGVLVLGMEGEVIQANQAAAAFFDTNAGPWMGKPLREVLATQVEADILEALEPFIEARLAGISHQMDITIDGRVFNLRGIPVYEAQRPMGQIVIAQDITQQVYAQEELEQSLVELNVARQRYRELVNSVPGMVYELNQQADGRLLFNYVSNSCAEMNGVTPEQVYASAELLIEQIEPAYRELWLDSLSKSAVDQIPFNVKVRKQVNGRTIWREFFATPSYPEPDLVIWHGIELDVSIREEAKAAQQQSEEMLRSIVGSLDDLIFALDGQGHFVAYYQNNQSDKLYNAPSLFLGKHYSEVLPDSAANQLTEAIATLHHTGQVQVFDYELVIQGELRSFNAKISQRESYQTAAGVTIVVRDVTEQTKALQYLKASEERFRQLTMNAPMGILRATNSGQITFTNPTWNHITGLPPELANDWQRFVHPDDLARLQQERLATIVQGHPIHTEYRLCYPDLTNEKWLAASAVPIYDEQGQFVEYLGTIQDITENKRKIEDTADFQNYLKALQLVGMSLAQAPDLSQFCYQMVHLGREQLGFDRLGLFLIDHEQQILVGTVGTDPTGNVRLEGDFKSPLLDEVWATEVDASPDRTKAWPREPVYDYGEAIGTGWKVATAIWTEQGTLGYLITDNYTTHREMRPYERELLALFGAVGGYLLALKQQEEALMQAKEAAEAASVAKSRFLASISHELRTPLNAIMGFAELLTTSDLNTADQERVGIINSSGQHLLALINDVLEISKIEAGRGTLNPQDFDLPEMIQQTFDMYEARAGQKQISYQLELSPTLPRLVFGDRMKLRQIILNLLSNAIKFTSAGLVRLVVDSPQPNQLVIVVRDTGVGMSNEDQKDLFKPFSQTAAGRSMQQGTGLGLALAAEYVRLMEGHLILESKLHIGTTITIHLPVQPTPSNAPSATRPMPPLNSIRHARLDTGEPARILVVDDTLTNISLLETWLKRLGFVVETADSGALAIQSTAEFAPHLILMDLWMPEMDGFQTTARLRVQYPDLPILAFSASVFESPEKLHQAGFNGFIMKPIQIKGVLDAMAVHLPLTYDVEGAVHSTPQIKTPTAETTIPPHIIHQLATAVHELNLAKTEQAIQAIAAYDPQTAVLLTKYMDIFDLSKIEQWVEKFK